MVYTEKAKKVLIKYHILRPTGEVYLAKKTDKSNPNNPEEIQPLIDEETVERLITADPTEDQRWLDWIFLQACGGTAAQEASKSYFNDLKQKFVKMFSNAFVDSNTGKRFPALPLAKIERKWEEAKPKLKYESEVAPEYRLSMRDFHGCFGYYHSWPGGPSRIYAKIESAIAQYYRQIKELRANEAVQKDEDEYARLGEMESSVEPRRDFPTFDDLVRTNVALGKTLVKVDFRMARRTGQKDDVIYDDDFFTVTVPLTWAAAARYGYGTTKYSDPEEYEKYINGRSSVNHEKKPRESLEAYVTFNCPAPSILDQSKQPHVRYEIHEFVIYLPRNQDSIELQKASLLDIKFKHGDGTLADVIYYIEREVDRKDDPVKDPYCVHGAAVYKSKQEADEVVAHLKKAVTALITWYVEEYQPPSETPSE